VRVVESQRSHCLQSSPLKREIKDFGSRVGVPLKVDGKIFNFMGFAILTAFVVKSFVF
jgi:hypothetical protein